MVEIKNIIFTNCNMNFILNSICLINHLLPIRLKFANETFVALEDSINQGQITLDKDSLSSKRFKITKLILEENATSIAKQLVSYAITRYRAMGANSFYVVADEKQADLINIFKNELNFRMCGCEYLYKINFENVNYSPILKPFKKEDIKPVCNFYNNNINSFNRFLFSREEYQFLNNYTKYIFYDNKKEEILGYFEVATKNKQDYYINFIID